MVRIWLSALFLSFLILPSQVLARAVERPKVATLEICKKEFAAVEAPHDIFKGSLGSARYVYSPYWGWVDLQHFSKIAAFQDSLNLLKYTQAGFHLAVLAGETHEQVSEPVSKYSYEDFISNFLGASFQYMYNIGYLGRQNFADAFFYFLTSIEVSNQPDKDAPNFLELNDVEILGATNRKYTPVFNTKSSFALTNRVQMMLNSLRIGATIYVNSSTTARDLMISNSKSLQKKLQDIDKRHRD